MSFKLRENISKYMKYMEFVQAASPLTLKSYNIDIDQTFKNEICSHLEKQTWSEDELMTLVRQAFSRWAKLSLSSRNRKGATLKSFFSWAFAEGLLSKDLSFQVICPKVPKKIPHFLSVDEAVAVLRTLEADKNLEAELLLFLVIYGGGLRVSEACALQWSEVHFEQKILRLRGKGNKERVVALPAMTLSRLREWKKNHFAQDFVFGEQALNPRTAYEMIRQSGKKAGLIQPLNPHALRHSFATHLLSSGANLRTLQELLGHENLTATEKYTHLGVDQLARTLESFHPLGNTKK